MHDFPIVRSFYGFRAEKVQKFYFRRVGNKFICSVSTPHKMELL
jgi:regulation of enolase protein 1 (concanavalin A-like superfamily)